MIVSLLDVYLNINEFQQNMILTNVHTFLSSVGPFVSNQATIISNLAGVYLEFLKWAWNANFKVFFLSLNLSKNTNIYANTAIKHILAAGCCLNCLDEFEMQICTFPSLRSKRANQQQEAEYHNHSHHRRHHIIQKCYSICLQNPFESKYVIFSSNRSFLCYYARLEILVHS